MTSTRVIIDWSQITCATAFYDAILSQCDSPLWHGRNLDALNDSWVTGGINTGGPPYDFEICNMDKASPEVIPIVKAVLEIAHASVAANGGSCVLI